MILTTKYSSIIDKCYKEFKLVEELINLIMESNYQVVILEESEFKEKVEEYKEHMNDSNYYIFREENNSLIIFKDIEKKEEVGYTNLVQKAIDVFGQEKIEIE